VISLDSDEFWSATVVNRIATKDSLCAHVIKILLNHLLFVYFSQTGKMTINGMVFFYKNKKGNKDQLTSNKLH